MKLSWMGGLALSAAIVASSGGFAKADKLDDIKARGKLLVGAGEASPPFSFRDGAKGIVG